MFGKTESAVIKHFYGRCNSPTDGVIFL